MGSAVSRLCGGPGGSGLVLAYDTAKEVRVLDKRLGLIYHFFTLAAFLYVLAYVFMARKGYLDVEKTNGLVLTKVITPVAGTATPQGFDIFDFSTNPGEQGAVFLPTRILITKGQEQDGYCESPLHTCKAASDCDIGNDALQKPECRNQRCVRRQWCPAQMPGDPKTETKSIDIETYDIWFRTDLHFHRFALDVSTTEENLPIRWPAQRANTYTVRELLKMASLKLDEVKENGAILAVDHHFDCDLTVESCDTHVQVGNIDSKTGFNYVRSHYYTDAKTKKQKRDTYRLYGIRIIAMATGTGYKVSPAQILLWISSGVALALLAAQVADFVLLHVIPERRHYSTIKIISTDRNLSPE